MDPSKLKVTELRGELRRRNLSTAGVKQVLIDRLQESFNAGGTEQSTIPVAPELPDGPQAETTAQPQEVPSPDRNSRTSESKPRDLNEDEQATNKNDEEISMIKPALERELTNLQRTSELAGSVNVRDVDGDDVVGPEGEPDDKEELTLDQIIGKRRDLTEVAEDIESGAFSRQRQGGRGNKRERADHDAAGSRKKRKSLEEDDSVPSDEKSTSPPPSPSQPPAHTTPNGGATTHPEGKRDQQPRARDRNEPTVVTPVSIQDLASPSPSSEEKQKPPAPHPIPDPNVDHPIYRPVPRDEGKGDLASSDRIKRTGTSELDGDGDRDVRVPDERPQPTSTDQGVRGARGEDKTDTPSDKGPGITIPARTGEKSIDSHRPQPVQVVR